MYMHTTHTYPCMYIHIHVYVPNYLHPNLIPELKPDSPTLKL